MEKQGQEKTNLSEPSKEVYSTNQGHFANDGDDNDGDPLAVPYTLQDTYISDKRN
jgi:hypothetical protein